MSALTIQQARAMTSFLWSGLRGFSDDACDGDVWDRGVRPWPTMRNLEAKGLVTSEWFSPDDGYTYHLTRKETTRRRAAPTKCLARACAVRSN